MNRRCPNCFYDGERADYNKTHWQCAGCGQWNAFSTPEDELDRHKKFFQTVGNILDLATLHRDFSKLWQAIVDAREIVHAKDPEDPTCEKCAGTGKKRDGHAIVDCMYCNGRGER